MSEESTTTEETTAAGPQAISADNSQRKHRINTYFKTLSSVNGH